MSTLNIANVVNVSVATPPAGLADFQINNLAIFTPETPINPPGPFGVYLSPTDVAADWGTTSEAYLLALQIFSQSPNILAGNGSLIIFPMTGGETLAAAIARVTDFIFFGGALFCGYAPNDAEILAAAAVVQPLKRLLFAPTNLTSALSPGGLAYQVQALKYTYTRVLLYTLGATLARTTFAPAYAGRGMSVDFSGSATTLTMHLKDLVGVAPDTGITQTVLNSCIAIGADVYANVAGLPKVFCTGGNDFFDNVYNLTWLVFALEVAGFNAIATTPTKLPQTEPGVAVLRGAYISVLQAAVRNGFIAPGAWNSPELFGDPVALVRNVLQIGYYIFSLPVNQQLQTDRAARKAPLIQLAIKFAGAIHSSNVIVNVNA